jgi:hypothetical protein
MNLLEYEICQGENNFIYNTIPTLPISPTIFMYNKKHLIAVLGYLGIWFIGWAISHWFFSGTRSIIMASIGIILFLISEYLTEWEKNYGHIIIWGVVYSIAVGMISGWFQHFLDSPWRSLWIVPVGWFISTAIFPYKEWLRGYALLSSLWVGALISIILTVLLYVSITYLPKNIFLPTDHHDIISSWSIDIVSWTDTQAIITDTDAEHTSNHEHK